MAKIQQCPDHPYSGMVEMSRKKVLDHPSPPPALAYNMRHMGHPHMAMFVTIMNGVKGVANYFFEEVTYECRRCNYRTTAFEKRKK